MGVPAYKVAAFEITDIPLIEYIASKGKPIIISTGIATISDIQDAIDACKGKGNDQIVILKCTSSYPAPTDEANLLTMKNMEQTFGVPVGLSDHSLGNEVALAAVALGAKIIEKHFILDKKLGGPDAAFSMDPSEFGSMVKSIRTIEKALGSITYRLSDRAKASRTFCRSLFVVKDIAAGELLTKDNIKSIRPGFGILPKHGAEVIGRQARHNIAKGTPLKWDLID